MDLLGAYGSDSDHEQQAVPAPAPTRTGLFSVLPPPKNDAAAQPATAPRPQPGSAGAKRVVSFLVPLKTDALGALDDEEDARPKKRAAGAQPTAGGLAALLPKPVNDDLGGGGFGGGGGAGGGTKLDLGDSRQSQHADDAPAAAPSRAAAHHPSTAFRVDVAPDLAATAAHPSLMYMVAPGSACTAAERASWLHGDTAGAAVDDGLGHRHGEHSTNEMDVLLERAIEEDRLRGGNTSAKQRALQRPTVVEVSQAELTAGRERLAATKSVTGMAFGPEAEARLRAEAGAKPSDVQRRKHQIGSLLHDAKLQELKALEGRLQGMKTKRETMAKYGW